MQAVIIAGGLATRLRPLTLSKPKSLITIKGKPFLEYQIELLKRNGIFDIVLCTGFLGEQIKSYFLEGQGFGVRIRYSQEERPLGTAGALKKASDLLDESFFTLYGDSYIFVDFKSLFRYFQPQSKLALMTVYNNRDRYDRSNTSVEGSLVKKYSKTDKTPDMTYIEYGVDLFRKEVLDLIPADETYGLEDLFPGLIKQKQLLSYEIKERFYEIGSLQGLKEFEYFVEKQA